MKQARDGRMEPRAGQSVCGVILAAVLLLPACSQPERPRPAVDAGDVITAVQEPADRLKFLDNI